MRRDVYGNRLNVINKSIAKLLPALGKMLEHSAASRASNFFQCAGNNPAVLKNSNEQAGPLFIASIDFYFENMAGSSFCEEGKRSIKQCSNCDSLCQNDLFNLNSFFFGLSETALISTSAIYLSISVFPTK